MAGHLCYDRVRGSQIDDLANREFMVVEIGCRHMMLSLRMICGIIAGVIELEIELSINESSSNAGLKCTVLTVLIDM